MKKITIYILGIIWLLVLAYLWYRYYQSSQSDNLSDIKIWSHSRKVENAITDQEKIIWLMNRSFLDKDKWMIFIWQDDLMRNFWMKNTMIPLDIIFIDSGNNIVNIKTGTPYDLTALSSNKPARYVLEINWWQAAEYDINIWDKVNINLSKNIN